MNPWPSAASIPLLLCFRAPHTPSCPNPPDLKSQRLRRCLSVLFDTQTEIISRFSLTPARPAQGRHYAGRRCQRSNAATITSALQDQNPEVSASILHAVLFDRRCVHEVVRNNAVSARRSPKITPHRQHCRGSVVVVLTTTPSTQPPGNYS